MIGRLRVPLTLAAIGLAVAAGIAHAASHRPETAGSPDILRAKAVWSGRLYLDFQGSRTHGCARLGACRTTGHLSFRPGGSLTVVLPGAKLDFLDLVKPEPAGTVISPAGTCAPESGALTPVASLTGETVTITLREANIVDTECGGPLTADIIRLLPRTTMSLAAFKRGGPLRLTGGGRFATPGFTGTVRSTITAQLAPAHPSGHQSAPDPSLSEPLTLGRIAGVEHARLLRPGPYDICSLAGNCGRSGTLSWRPEPGEPVGTLTASGPPGTTELQLKSALHGGQAPAGVTVSGRVVWASGGSVRESEHQDVSCRDRAPLGAGFIGIDYWFGGLRAQYEALGDVHTRCPGPLLDGGAATRFPVRLLRRPVFTMHLPVPTRAGCRPISDCEDARYSGGFTVTLRAGPAPPRRTASSR